ncbi:MAG: hypothetical protein IRY99_21945 [Isosphaeraceae bacterium]|nr:hypothetical protein [Isosphaeraceae bacterium]
MHAPEPEEASTATPDGGAIAVAEAPPRVRRRLVASPDKTYRQARRTLAIRHVGGHRLVAILEIASPSNKDRATSVEEFADKIDLALRFGCHVLLVDLFPPGPHDPRGLHGAAWERYGDEEDLPRSPLDAGLVRGPRATRGVRRASRRRRGPARYAAVPDAHGVHQHPAGADLPGGLPRPGGPR